MRNKYINKYEIRFIGMQRSGHHSILNWIAGHFKENVCFLNHVDPNTNPFKTFKEKGTIKFNKKFNKKYDINLERIGRFSEKECLMYNYEDELLKNVPGKLFKNKHNSWVGPSKNQINILVLRDPYNLFSSRLKHYYNLYFSRLKNNYFSKNKKNAFIGTIEKKKMLYLWKSYAREFLGETNYLGPNKIVINYNKWFISKEYRQSISSQLNLKFTDKNLKEVPGQGSGSSFDKQKYDKRGDEMDVLNRWKYYEHNPYYKSLFIDTELRELSKKIFGDIPGTEKIHRLSSKEKIKMYGQKILMNKHSLRIIIDKKIGQIGIIVKQISPRSHQILSKFVPKSS